MKLAEKAVLMRLSISLPGEARQDRQLSEAVKSEHALGADAGRWVKALFPPQALECIKKLDNEARGYHAEVTLPWDNGIGILPAPLVLEYQKKMNDFRGKREQLVESHFLAQYDKWIEWAKSAHNGTFDADNYPPLEEMRGKFAFRSEPLPVPESEHFSSTLASLLGTDTETVNRRVNEAVSEAQRELVRRVLAPVKAMAEKLAEIPKNGKDDIVFRDTLVGNVQQIVELAPKLNICGDVELDILVKEIADKLGSIQPADLRKDKAQRAKVQESAAALMKRLEGYRL